MVAAITPWTFPLALTCRDGARRGGAVGDALVESKQGDKMGWCKGALNDRDWSLSSRTVSQRNGNEPAGCRAAHERFAVGVAFTRDPMARFGSVDSSFPDRSGKLMDADQGVLLNAVIVSPRPLARGMAR